jgi:hypothetical protein
LQAGTDVAEGCNKMRLAQMHKINGSNSALDEFFHGAKREVVAEAEGGEEVEEEEYRAQRRRSPDLDESPLLRGGALPTRARSKGSSSSSPSSPGRSRRSSLRSFEQENMRLRALLQSHLDRMKHSQERRSPHTKKKKSRRDKETSTHDRHHHHHRHLQSSTAQGGSGEASRRRKSARKGQATADQLGLEIQRIRDAKIAEALRSAESGTTGVRAGPAQERRRASTRPLAKAELARTSAATAHAKRRRRSFATGVMEDSETEEEGDIEDCSSDGGDDDDEDSSTTGQESDATSTREFSPCEDELQCKMGWEKRRKHGAVVESGYQSDDGGNADDGRREEEEDSDVDYSSASSSDDASWEDDSDREASEQGEQVGSEEEEDSTESDSESESENESEDDEGGQSRPGCTKEKEKEKGKEKEDSKGRFYNFYRNSLFREQQRLSSGLISPRKGLM